MYNNIIRRLRIVHYAHKKLFLSNICIYVLQVYVTRFAKGVLYTNHLNTQISPIFDSYINKQTVPLCMVCHTRMQAQAIVCDPRGCIKLYHMYVHISKVLGGSQFVGVHI